MSCQPFVILNVPHLDRLVIGGECELSSVGTFRRRLNRVPSSEAMPCGFIDEQPATRTAKLRGRNNLRNGQLLHIRIIGTTAPFGRDPGNILRRILDVAGFAMDAILRIDLEARH